MVMDHNPSFAEDKSYDQSARKVADVLWSASQGDLSRIPDSYLSTMGHEYADGSVSLLDQLNKLTFDKQPTYEEFAEVVESLIRVDPNEWPDPDTIVELPASKLLYEVEPEPFEFGEYDMNFAEPGDMSDKMELFFKKVISSVYTDGVTSVTDKDGNPPNMQNRYLMAPDGKSFSGIFFDAPAGEESKQYPFKIAETAPNQWQILY